MFKFYRQLEAQNIFNHTGLQVSSFYYLFLILISQKSRDYRLNLEKYIADHQNPLLIQKKRSEELLHISIQEIASRAQSKMKYPSCENDLIELNQLLVNFYNQNMKLIEIQHKKSSRSFHGKDMNERKLTLLMKENQVSAQNLKRSIEEYVNALQYSSKCDDHHLMQSM